MKWPLLQGSTSEPVWTGKEFLLGSERTKVLCYHETKSGWCDDLTQIHEDTIGAGHFIDCASRRNAINALCPILKLPNPTILEVGCSSGFFLQDLRCKASHATLIGSDFISGPLLRLADRLPGLPLLQFDITACPLEDASFDAVVMLNVLEHIKNDLVALQQTYRILKKGGVAVLEVPAGPHLYDYYDKHLMHFRRYRLQEVELLAHDAGFEIVHASHLGFFLYPFFSIVKKRNKRKIGMLSDSDQKKMISGQIKQNNTNLVLHALMRIELELGKYVRYPVGIRCFLVLRK